MGVSLRALLIQTSLLINELMNGLYMLHVRQFLDYSPFIYYKDFQRDLGRSLYLQKEKEHKHPIMTAKML